MGPYMPAPRQRSLHSGGRGVLPHLTHLIAVSRAWPVCVQLPRALIESSLHPIRQILLPRISQEKREAQKSHVISSNHTATMSELDFDIKTLAPKPPGKLGKWLCNNCTVMLTSTANGVASWCSPPPAMPFPAAPSPGREHWELPQDLASKAPMFQFPQGSPRPPLLNILATSEISELSARNSGGLGMFARADQTHASQTHLGEPAMLPLPWPWAARGFGLTGLAWPTLTHRLV